MKLVIIGATGRTGRRVTDLAMARGHEVTAIVRNTTALSAAERFHVIVGDVLRADLLVSIFVEQDAIISCLGQRSRDDAHLLQDSATATLAAMSQSGVRRYLVVSQGLLFPSRNPVIHLLRLILARHVGDSAAMEDRVRASATDWTIVRAPRLFENGTPRGYRVEVGALPSGPWTMHYGDLAAFLVDAAEKRAHVREIVGLTSA